MRKLSVVVLAIAVIAFAAFPAFAQKELRVVGSWSSLTMYQNLEKPFWTEKLPEAMDGEVSTIMTSLGQINMQGAAVLRGMEQGIFDVVCTVVDYIVSDCPELAGLDLPVLAPNIEDAREVVEAYRPVMSKALEDSFNAKLLSVVPYPAQVLFTTKEIGGLEDIKGMKIRASGWTTSQFIDALGATGVTISFGEVPQSLQRGVVEGAVTGSLSGYSAGWGEVTSYLYPIPIGGWDYVMTVMSLDTWNSFSEKEQQLIQSLITEEVEQPGWKVTDKETQAGINCLTGTGPCSYGEANSLGLIEVSESDIKLARQILLDNVLPAWVEKVDDAAVNRWKGSIGDVVGLDPTVQ
ncbi:MAG: TRAP transporter substrate-binding protein [Synergistales bacterium]|nr:TRAP transporter substrate-binding protein [Synergistales bacterium]